MHPAASGAVSGAFWGMLIGWLFLMPVAGAAVGAAGGALGGSLIDVGINDEDMRTQANEALKPGTAGLFLLIRRMATDKVLEDPKGVGGTVIRTSFDHAKEEALRPRCRRSFPLRNPLRRTRPRRPDRQLPAPVTKVPRSEDRQRPGRRPERRAPGSSAVTKAPRWRGSDGLRPLIPCLSHRSASH